MTTPAAANLYLAQHRYQTEGKGYAVFNPHNKPVEELPFILGFNNGGSRNWYQAVAVSEDGFELGSHICSHEGYMEGDLGILEGMRPDRHEESYKKHYPDGYRMDFIPTEKLRDDPRLAKALELNKARGDEQAKEKK